MFGKKFQRTRKEKQISMTSHLSQQQQQQQQQQEPLSTLHTYFMATECPPVKQRKDAQMWGFHVQENNYRAKDVDYVKSSAATKSHVPIVSRTGSSVCSLWI